jgi:hypothetical protein
MRNVAAVFVALGMLAGACAATEGSDAGAATTTAAPDPSADIYGAATEQIVTGDNTFGGLPTFSTVLVVDHVDPHSGSADDSRGEERSLTSEERAAIEAALENDAEVRFIADPLEYMTEDLAPTLEGSAIVTVGSIEHRADHSLVGVSLWCGGLCGIWLTYRLVDGMDGWAVTGIEGPIAVA